MDLRFYLAVARFVAVNNLQGRNHLIHPVNRQPCFWLEVKDLLILMVLILSVHILLHAFHTDGCLTRPWNVRSCIHLASHLYSALWETSVLVLNSGFHFDTKASSYSFDRLSSVSVSIFSNAVISINFHLLFFSLYFGTHCFKTSSAAYFHLPLNFVCSFLTRLFAFISIY